MYIYICIGNKTIFTNILLVDMHNHGSFKGSTLELRGFWDPPFNTMEWSVMGGTGKFRFAQGFLIGKKYAEDSTGRDFELTIHVSYRPIVGV